jgi:hypothetical protein
MLFIAVLGAVAYVVAVCQARRNQRAEDDEATNAWENEGGAPLSDV